MANAGIPPTEWALWQKVLAKKMADMPVGFTPTNLAGVLAQALLKMAKTNAKVAGVASRCPPL